MTPILLGNLQLIGYASSKLCWLAIAMGSIGCHESTDKGARGARPDRVAAGPELADAGRPMSALGIPCPAPSAAQPSEGSAPSNGLSRLLLINHFVIIYLENHSFDNVYGQFPDADGLLDAECKVTMPKQVDALGAVWPLLPNPPSDGQGALFANLPNQPFDITPLVPANAATLDLTHAFNTQQAQINGGAMNKFATYSNAASLTVGFYDTMRLPVPQIARDFTVCDRFFHSAFGGSFLNHMWLVSARTPVFPDRVRPDAGPAAGESPFPVRADGTFTGDEPSVTPDGHVVNTTQSINTPHPNGLDPASLLPSQTYPTIGDRLSDANLSWAWYSGGWNAALAHAAGEAAPDGGPSAPEQIFQYHHQPFVYFANFADGTAAKAEHLKDEIDFLRDVKEGTLPAVSFVKPAGIHNEHPGYTDLLRGEEHVAELIRAVMAGPNWHDTAIIITYDENGGFADHVPPPVIDRWGPGTRVPAVIISPLARKRFVDHTPYETVSILATLERRWGLEPLTSRDANASDFSPAFASDD